MEKGNNGNKGRRREPERQQPQNEEVRDEEDGVEDRSSAGSFGRDPLPR